MFKLCGNAIECVIFDKDGVLVNSEPYHKIFSREFYELLGISHLITAEEQNSFVGKDVYKIWKYIKNKCGLKQSVEQLVKEETEYKNKRFMEADIPVIEGIPELLEYLKKHKIPIAVASSSSRGNIEYSLGKHNLLVHFEGNVVSSHDQDVLKGKPEPDIFLKAARIIGIAPERCVVIEDSENGVKAAKNAGMPCIGYANPDSGNQDLSAADFVVNSLRDIQNLLNNYIL